MQDNEFEKQFKKLMDDFNISPSAGAWKKIKSELHQRHRRKLPLVILLVSVLCGAGIFTAYTLMHNNKSKKIAVENRKQMNEPVTQDVHKLPSAEEHAPIKNPGTLSINNIQNKKEKTQPLSFKKLNTGVPKFSLNKINATSKINKNPVYKNNTNNYTVTTSDSNYNILKKPSTPDLPSVYNNNKPLINSTENNDTALTSSQSNTAWIAKNDTALTAVKQSAKINMPAKNKPAKWQFGLMAAVGKNNAVNDWFNTNKSGVSAAYLNNPGAPLSIDTTVVKKIYKPSTAYNVTLTAQRKIFKNAFISTGIGFTHVATKTMVQGGIDSVSSVQDPSNYFIVRGFYRPGMSSYTNTYNFIELPLLFQQNFKLTKELFFSYNAGVSLRQLVKSKSLLYNLNSNVYYADNSLLNKTQWQVMAGADLTINVGKTASVYVGPQLSYSLSGLTKNVYNPDFHFINYGLKAGLLLHRK